MRPEQIMKILELTDSFNIHRESVFIPLKTEEKGNVSILPDGRLSITCPSTHSFDQWLEEIRTQLLTMDLTKVAKKLWHRALDQRYLSSYIVAQCPTFLTMYAESKTLLHKFVRYPWATMWRQISERVKDYPGRQKVAKALVEFGLSIKENSSIYCGGIELSDVKIARHLGVDRRTVRETAELISSDPRVGWY